MSLNRPERCIPYIPEGSSVTARFNGSFCEAVVKSVNRQIKLKVVYVGDDGDEEVAVVEESNVFDPIEFNQEVNFIKGTRSFRGKITKILDQSTYKVLFNDGDERILKRSSINFRGGTTENGKLGLIRSGSSPESIDEKSQSPTFSDALCQNDNIIQSTPPMDNDNSIKTTNESTNASTNQFEVKEEKSSLINGNSEKKSDDDEAKEEEDEDDGEFELANLPSDATLEQFVEYSQLDVKFDQFTLAIRKFILHIERFAHSFSFEPEWEFMLKYIDDLNSLVELSKVVHSYGDGDAVCSLRKWKEVGMEVGINNYHSTVSYITKRIYTKLLHPFEKHILAQSELSDTANQVSTAENSDKVCCCHPTLRIVSTDFPFLFLSKKVQKPQITQAKTANKSAKKKSPASDPQDAVVTSCDNALENESLSSETSPLSSISSASPFTCSSNTSSSEVSADSPPFQTDYDKDKQLSQENIVCAKPHPGRPRRLKCGQVITIKDSESPNGRYQAKILEMDSKERPSRLLVHYKGWNSRFDEWVPVNRILSSTKLPPSRGRKKGKRLPESFRSHFDDCCGSGITTKHEAVKSSSRSNSDSSMKKRRVSDSNCVNLSDSKSIVSNKRHKKHSDSDFNSTHIVSGGSHHNSNSICDDIRSLVSSEFFKVDTTIIKRKTRNSLQDALLLAVLEESKLDSVQNHQPSTSKDVESHAQKQEKCHDGRKSAKVKIPDSFTLSNLNESSTMQIENCDDVKSEAFDCKLSTQQFDKPSPQNSPVISNSNYQEIKVENEHLNDEPVLLNSVEHAVTDSHEQPSIEVGYSQDSLRSSSLGVLLNGNAEDEHHYQAECHQKLPIFVGIYENDAFVECGLTKLVVNDPGELVQTTNLLKRRIKSLNHTETINALSNVMFLIQKVHKKLKKRIFRLDRRKNKLEMSQQDSSNTSPNCETNHLKTSNSNSEADDDDGDEEIITPQEEDQKHLNLSSHIPSIHF